MQLLIGERAFFARFALPNNCRLVPSWPGQMSVQAIFREIEFAADKPLCKRRFPFENFFPRRAPEKFACFARPKLGGLPDRFPIHPPVLTEAFNTSLLREIFGRRENTLLDEMRFDVV